MMSILYVGYSHNSSQKLALIFSLSTAYAEGDGSGPSGDGSNGQGGGFDNNFNIGGFTPVSSDACTYYRKAPGDQIIIPGSGTYWCWNVGPSVSSYTFTITQCQSVQIGTALLANGTASCTASLCADGYTLSNGSCNKNGSGVGGVSFSYCEGNVRWSTTNWSATNPQAATYKNEGACPQNTTCTEVGRHTNGGSSSCVPNNTVSNPTSGSLSISANPMNCTIPAGASNCPVVTISFPHITPNDYNKCVYVTDTAGTEKKFACGSTGEATTATASWISKGDFKFTVYKESSNSPERSTGVSVIVTGTCASGSAWNGSVCATGATAPAPSPNPAAGTTFEPCGIAQKNVGRLSGTGGGVSLYSSNYDSSKSAICDGILTMITNGTGGILPASNDPTADGFIGCGWYYKNGNFNKYSTDSRYTVSGTTKDNFACVYNPSGAAAGSCDTTPLVAKSGLGGTTGTYCEKGALWSTANWISGSNQTTYKNISDQCVNGAATTCKYGCKVTGGYPGSSNFDNSSAHCITLQESGIDPNVTIGGVCRLYTTHRGYPAETIDSSYNLGHLQTLNGVTKCILDINATTGGGTPGKFNDTTSSFTPDTSPNSCWMYTGTDGLPVLGGNVGSACKSYFALQCAVQFTNRVSRHGSWSWDTRKCDYTAYGDKDVTMSGAGLTSATSLTTDSSDYIAGSGSTGKYIGKRTFQGQCGGLYYNTWTYDIYKWGSCLGTAQMGEWNGVNPNDPTNTVTLAGGCGTGYYRSGNDLLTSFTGTNSGPTKVTGTQAEVSNGTACYLTGSTFISSNGTPLPNDQRYTITSNTQSCCINTETYVGMGFSMCKNENYLQTSMRSCKDLCQESGFSPRQPIPNWCPGVTKSCSCAAKYNGTQGNYTVGGTQDCLTNAPATQPTTCAASVPTISCGAPTQTTITLSGSNVPTNSGACSLILSPSDYSSPSLTINSALQSTFTGQLATSLIPDKAYTASIICGGVTKASQSCRTAVATACTNGNTAQNVPSGSFNPTTMTTRRVVEDSGACLASMPAVSNCILPANSAANPTLYASQQLGAPSTAIANSNVCFDTVRNRMRIAADVPCGDTGVRATAACPAPQSPTMQTLGTTVFINSEAVIGFLPPRANMQCAVYGRNATGIDMTNIVSPLTTYPNQLAVIFALPASKQSVAQTYGYNAVCTDGGSTNSVQSGIINVNVVPAPIAVINPTAYDEGLATTTSMCTNADKWTISRVVGVERVGQALGNTGSNSYSFDTAFNIFMRSRTADIEAGSDTDGNRYPAADIELTCSKTITSTTPASLTASGQIVSTEQSQVTQTATATLKLTTLTARVLIDKDGVFSTSADRSPAAGIPVTYRMQRTSNTNNTKGEAIFVAQVGYSYSDGFSLDNLPNHLEYIGTILKDGTLSDINGDSMPSQVAGSCAAAIPDAATLARYKAVHQGNPSATFNQADLDFVKSQSDKTCAATDTECNRADINGNGSVNAADVGIVRSLVGNMLASTCALGNGFYDKDIANDTHTMLLKYKTPILLPVLSTTTYGTSLTINCEFGDSLYVNRTKPEPKTSVYASSTHKGTLALATIDTNATYVIECANHGYATATATIAPSLSVNVTQNAIVPISTPATIKWTSNGNSCEIMDYAGASFSPKIEKTSTTGTYEHTFPANTPYFNLGVTHLPGSTPSDIGLKIVCKDSAAPTATVNAMANIIVYAPVTASVAVPPNTTTGTLSCGGSYNKATISIPNNNLNNSEVGLPGGDPTGNPVSLLNTTVLYDRTVAPVVGQVGPWSYPNMTSDKVYTLTCSGYGPSATAVYPTGAFTLNAEINADVAQSTDKLAATSSASQGRYTQLSWSTTGEGVTCNTTQTKQLSTGSFTAPANVSTSIGTSLAVPNAGTYTNNPVVKWTITCTDKNNTTLSKTLTLNVGSIPVAEIGTPVYNGRYYNPTTKEGAASTYEFSLKCTNATSYQVQKKVGNAWVNATGTNASGAITVSPWTGTIYKQPYKDTIDGQQFKLQCMNTELSDDSNIVTYSTASTYPFVTDFRTTVSEFTVVGADTYIVISPTIRNPVDCKVSVFEASDVTGFTTLAQFSPKAPASGSNSALMQSQVNTAYNGDAQPKLNTPAFQNGTQEGRINTVNLDKAKTFILTCPKYNAANPTTPIIDVCTKNNTSSRCIFTVYRKTTSAI